MLSRCLIFAACCGTLILVGCASRQDLPSSAEDIDFDAPGGWRSEHVFDPVGYEIAYQYPAGIDDIELALRAAKAGLAYAGLKVNEVNVEEQFVIGSRGPELNRNTEYAGVYLRLYEGRIQAQIIVHGETFGLVGERQQLGYVQQDIRKGIELFLAEEERSLKSVD